MTITPPNLRTEREGVAELAAKLRAPRLPLPAECRAIRKAAGATQRDIATALRVDPMTISRWERGLAEPWPRHHAAYLCLLAALAEIAVENGASANDEARGL